MRALISATLIASTLLTPAYAEHIWLTMDQVRPYKLDKPAHSIVVGNPSIADVTVQDSTKVLLFGKAPGLTNIYAFDQNGDAIGNMVIRVRTPSSDMLVVHRGGSRTTYNCTSNCEPTVTVGDDQSTFDNIAQQVTGKFEQARTATANE